jgi:hypothetical protein
MMMMMKGTDERNALFFAASRSDDTDVKATPTDPDNHALLGNHNFGEPSGRRRHRYHRRRRF